MFTMHRKLLLAALTFAVLHGALTAEVRIFGEPLTPDLEVIPIEAIVGEPDSWAGKKVRIAGKVTGVCAHQGCWIDLVSPENASMRVKVDDGVIVFPQNAVGHQAVAEGEVEILEMSREQYEAWLRHVAEELGKEFQPSEVGEGPHRIVRLRGHGAEIEGP
jgi:hypothetical protein